MGEPAVQPKQLSLTGQQMAALVLVETRAASLKLIDTQALTQMGAKSLAEAVIAAAKVLEMAHEAYVAETQRAVSIAGPQDIARLVKP